jgi:hypothetical protein
MTIKEYRALSSVCHTILSKEELLDEPENVREAFIDNLYKMLRTSLDISIEYDEFEAFMKKNEGAPSDLAQSKFLSKTLENPKTYVMINYYFSIFIVSILKRCSEDSYHRVLTIMRDREIDHNTLISAEREFYELLKGLKNKPRSLT